MKQSLLRKLLITILLILLGTFITGQIAGFFIIRNYFLNEELKEITPQMREVAEEIKINNGSIIVSDKQHFIIKAYDLGNNEIPIIPGGNHKDEKLFSDEEIKSGLLPYMDKALTGNMVSNIVNLKNIKGKSIIIGFPINDKGKVIGSIFTIEPSSDFDVIINTFYLVFFIASVISTSIILILIYYFTRKRIKPLAEMVEISNSMAAGDFRVRAKENGYGEIKKLSNNFPRIKKIAKTYQRYVRVITTTIWGNDNW